MREHPAAPPWRPVLRALCAELHDLRGVSASVAIAIDDDVVFETAVGPRCAEGAEPLQSTTVLGVGSITKLVTTTLALDIAAREGLSLDAPLSAALPELSPAPSLRALLSHTAGLRDPEPLDMLSRGDDWPALIAEQREAAGAHVYANANFLLVGRWLEHTTGRAYADLYATEPGLAPLRDLVHLTIDPSMELACGHMKSRDWTAFDPKTVPPLPAWTLAAGGGLASASSLVRLPFALERTGRLPAMVQTRVASERAGWEYGLGVRLRGEGREQVLAHSGNTGTYWAELQWSPAEKVSVAVLSTTPQAFEATVLAALTAGRAARRDGRTSAADPTADPAADPTTDPAADPAASPTDSPPDPRPDPQPDPRAPPPTP